MAEEPADDGGVNTSISLLQRYSIAHLHFIIQDKTSTLNNYCLFVIFCTRLQRVSLCRVQLNQTFKPF